MSLPFVLVHEAFKPLLDRHIPLRIGFLDISGGWIGFASMVLRLALKGVRRID